MSPAVSWLLVGGVFGAALVVSGVLTLGRRGDAPAAGYPADVEAHIQDALDVANEVPHLRLVQS